MKKWIIMSAALVLGNAQAACTLTTDRNTAVLVIPYTRLVGGISVNPGSTSDWVILRETHNSPWEMNPKPTVTVAITHDVSANYLLDKFIEKLFFNNRPDVKVFSASPTTTDGLGTKYAATARVLQPLNPAQEVGTLGLNYRSFTSLHANTMFVGDAGWCTVVASPPYNGRIVVRNSSRVQLRTSVGGSTLYSPAVSTWITEQTMVMAANSITLRVTPSRIDMGNVTGVSSQSRNLSVMVAAMPGSRMSLTYNYTPTVGSSHKVTVDGKSLPVTHDASFASGQTQVTRTAAVQVWSGNKGAVAGNLLVTAKFI